MISGRAAFTLALGKDIYFQMAYALARSFLRNGTGAGVEFVIVADRPVSERPHDLANIRWIEIAPGLYGRGFSPKLHLDKLAPAERSMFIDADCLCVAPLAPAFDAFEGHAVSVIGKPISNGEWFGDVMSIRAHFGLDAYPRFNGGVYYIEPGEVAQAVYATARDVESRYDEVGFVRLRGSPNDEVCMAVAMALNDQKPVPDDGTIMNTLLEAKRGLALDALEGRAVLRNSVGEPGTDPFFELAEMRPALVHFLGRDIDEHPYRTEILALELVHFYGWPPGIARLRATLTSAWPWIAGTAAKNALRPLYRAILGTRHVRQGSR